MEARFETFTVLIAKISKAIRRIKAEEMSEFNLKSSHVSCLYYLYKLKMVTAKELCDVCEEDKAAVSRSIEHLEKQGFLTRGVKMQKAYKSPIELTEKGKIVAEKIAQKIDRVLKDTSRGIGEQDLIKLYEGLSVISKNLQEICDNYQD